MTDIPIIFSGPMVRALLDGRKTMTRRLAWRERTSPFGKEGSMPTKERVASPWQKVKPGDRLWVRENFAILPRNCYALPKTPAPDPDMAAYYTADFDRSGKPGWKPSIHMPRWASRLTLTVTAVKVERLKEISEEDAVAEGLTPISIDDWTDEAKARVAPATCLWEHVIKKRSRRCSAWHQPTLAFRELWEDLHGAGAWESNPEVVALTFTVEKRNIDA